MEITDQEMLTYVVKSVGFLALAAAVVVFGKAAIEIRKHRIWRKPQD